MSQKRQSNLFRIGSNIIKKLIKHLFIQILMINLQIENIAFTI